MEKFDKTLDIDGNKVKFGGINVHDSKQALDLSETDDEKNVIGNGSSRGKRPGMRLLYQVGSSEFIYDMVRASYATSTPAGYDSLFMLLSGNGHERIAQWALTLSSGNYTNLGNLTTAGNGWLERNLVAGATGIYVTSERNTSDYWNITNVSGTTGYTKTKLSGTQCPSVKFTSGIRFKGHCFAFRGVGTGSTPHRLEYSNPTDFLTWTAATDYNIVDAGCITGGFIGACTDGERLYLSKSREIWMVTGATTENFRAERISNVAGFFGVRSMCMAGDLLMGFSTEAGPSWEDGTTGMESYSPRNIMAIQNGQVGLVGHHVLPFLKDISYFSLIHPKAEYDSQNQWMLLLPADSVDVSIPKALMLVFDTDGKTWGRWEFASTNNNQPISILYAPGPDATHASRMYVGTRAGMLGWLDPTYAYDDAPGSLTNNIESYWTSCWVNAWNCENFKSPEYVYIQGYQASGGQATLSIAYDYGAFQTVGTFDLKEDGVDIPVQSRTARSVKVKIQFANDGVGSEIRRVMLAQKPWGER